MFRKQQKTFHILLIEDNSGDIRLISEALGEAFSKGRLHCVSSRSETMEFLNQRGEYHNAPRPDLILLDLNLPGVHGHQILEEIKESHRYGNIPVVILSSSSTEEEVLVSYSLRAHSHRTKPYEYDQYMEVIKSITTCLDGSQRMNSLPFLA